jgi:curved DNA-binding protein
MDHYQTLGVAKNATPDEIKKAYRKLASQNHPDKGGDTATFQRIEEAYRTLSDSEKRQQYDKPAPQGFPGGFPGGFHFQQGPDINDIFGQMFGMRNGNPFQQHGHQVFRTQVMLTLEEMYTGTQRVLNLQLPTGPKAVNVDVPKGVESGSQIKYENIVKNGVLIIEFHAMQHLRFERRNADLYCNQSISVLDLIVGTSFHFNTISGKTLEVQVHPKTQPWMQLKIPGQGMPVPNSHLYGDQIILLKPFIPDIIPDEISESILRNRIV